MPTIPAELLPHRVTISTRFAAIAALATIAFAIVWRFSPWTHQYFYGDDLDYLLSVRAGSCATHVSEILTETCKERFRPVASGFVLATIDWFGAQMKYYNLLNFLLQFFSAALVFACALRLSRGRIVASAMVALAVATSRFALFDTTQAIGPVESIPFAAALSCVYCVLRFDGESSRPLRWAIGALAATFIAINAHERFVVLAVWLAVALVTSPRARAIPRNVVLSLLLACAALPAAYIGYKTLVLDTTFLIGTSETHLKPDLAQIVLFAGDAGWSLFGFNRGPAYLVGLETPIGPNLQTLLGIAFVSSWISLLLLGAVHIWRNHNIGHFAKLEQSRWSLLLVMLAAFALFPALLTIRLEHRWLLAPFAFLLLVAAWGAGNAPPKAGVLATILACSLGLSSIAIDSFAMRGYKDVFLVQSAHFAALAKRDIIDASPKANGPLRLIADESDCNWTLRYGRFFAVYGAGIRPVKCYSSLESAVGNGLPLGTELYSRGANDRLVNLTDVANSLVSGSTNGQSPTFDFLASFDAGKINDKRHVDTPTGSGVMRLPWDSTLGQREAMIILSGFSYRFDDVAVPMGASLDFGAGMLYPAPQPARLTIVATRAGTPSRTLLSLDLIPPAPGQSVDFQPRSVDLADFAGEETAFEFSVQSPGGDSTAHWIGLVKPVIVQDTTDAHQ